ncbi:hypothetical protein [Methyloversatilis sp. MC4-4]|uniref:hypothetical protein n=1 Tax=Methyloversatilis sp. MC4-4 TaxID=3132824 RepID=UPI003CF07277
MNYPYAAENRLDAPHAYMYAPYGGQDFLAAYGADRRVRLAQHLQGASCPPQGDLKAALSAAARALASGPALGGFSPADGVTLQPLLAALLGVLADGDVAAARPWLNRVVQRFEVSKKLYAAYAPGFRKGEGEARDPARYVELALCLALAHALTGHLQYLSTQLKLVDLLLSLDAGTLRPACPPERLALLVEAELAAVRMLALAEGVTVDVA